MYITTLDFVNYKYRTSYLKTKKKIFRMPKVGKNSCRWKGSSKRMRMFYTKDTQTDIIINLDGNTLPPGSIFLFFNFATYSYGSSVGKYTSIYIIIFLL